ncbi:unnamed protein product [Menidia menidia]|uniref:Protein-lysine N-methyltransferase SMYD4 n=1 Tax=Menidia menidia TaxID=238744 RepID=A0A8S4AN13_9TELE|nr:unnamed protein product [Menidia menidia]
MDLPCLRWQDHVAQKWTGLDPDLKENFTATLAIDDVFRCALSLTTQQDLDFLQSVSAGCSVRKDTEQATRCREMGNLSFKARDYRAAALHYSQGICFAPQRSEQLSLCFANRSAAVYHLQHYKECLDDINTALKNDYPSHLSHKLQERRTLCLNHLNQAGQDGRGEVRSASSGALTPGICPQAFVSYSKEKGRHLVATERIAAGEVLLVDRPYSCVLIPGMEEVKGKEGRGPREVLFGAEKRRCHRCLSETLCPVPCEGCSYSRYCSTGCRQEAWDEHHRWECPLGADLMVTGVLSQLALRVTLKAGLKNIQMARQPVSDEDEKGHSDPPSACTSHHGDSYLSVFHLLHHIDQHSVSLRFLCAVTIATLSLKLMKAGPPPFPHNFSKPLPATGQSPDGPITEREEAEGSELRLLGSAVLRHMLQLICNAQAVMALQDTGPENSSVQSRQEVRIATAIFPTLSLLNHSCCPNTSLTFSTGAAVSPCGSEPEDVSESGYESCGVTVTVRAAKVICPGQEIAHCYGPHKSRMKRQERQRLLRQQYYFLCRCEACSLQEEMPGDRGREPHESGFMCYKCKTVLKKGPENTGSGFTCSLSTCGNHMSSAEVNQKLEEIRSSLGKAVQLIETEMPGEALQFLKRTESTSGLILAETHPLRGELADATARAYATMGDWKNAASCLEQSVAATASQYGEDSIELGQQLFKLAQLHFNGGARGPALSVIPKVSRLLCLHCGPDCPELQELKAMEECLQG